MEHSMTATEFRAKCLGVFDRVAKTRDAFVITKRGKPKVRVVPLDDRPGSEDAATQSSARENR